MFATTSDTRNVLVLGSGGREHALAVSLAKSPTVKHVFVAPGNGGTATMNKGSNVALNILAFDDIALFAKEKDVDFVVVGPEQPLVEGITDHLQRNGVRVFGPSKAAAEMEASKAWSKEFMKRHSIPTAAYETFTNLDAAREYVEGFKGPVVIKASGLAAGKGVVLPATTEEAVEELADIMKNNRFGSAGSTVVIEERLEGPEVSVLCLSDGYTVAALPPAQDHKRAGDGDTGPNTGGMGAFAPTPVVTPALMKQITDTIIKPSVAGMRREGTPFVGCMFIGLMVTSSGPKLLEYNVRFGDPETQAVLPLVESDLAEVFRACIGGYLDAIPLQVKPQCSAAVVLVSNGYPGAYKKGVPITFQSGADADSVIFHAGTKAADGGAVVTNGGRVVAISSVADNIEAAASKCYTALASIHFDGMGYRTDIGRTSLRNIAPRGLTYADAGVSIDNGNALVERIKPLVRATMREGCNVEIGGFGGLFDMAAARYKDPILVSGTDGVGTKLRVAQLAGKHDTIGIDLVAMCVNDLIVQGAEPLFFLDYFATGELDVQTTYEVVKGIAEGCRLANCGLVGGETAEMPSMYAPGHYDLAGFSVGAVERAGMLPTLATLEAGDVLLGVASSGVHSNGFSLVRKIVDTSGVGYNDACPFDFAAGTATLGEALLAPTRIYIRACLPAVRKGLIKAMAHITGGGFTENIPRVLKAGLGAQVDAASFPLLPVFKWLKQQGGVAHEELARTFNCGIGMVLIVSADHEAEATKLLQGDGDKVYSIGKLFEHTDGERVIMKNTDIWDR